MPDTQPGQANPLGATVTDIGTNFSLFSKNCHAVELLLFDNAEDVRPSRIIALDPEVNRTFYYWHVLVPGVGSGQIYAWRVHGPFAPEMGLRFDGSKVILDPYTRAVTRTHLYDREAARRPDDNCAHALRGVVDGSIFDWEGDRPLHRPNSCTIVYELHVRGFTCHPSSGVESARAGTYAGLIEKIPYLHQLGITAVELMPVQQFDAQQGINGHSNYWGYSPLALFAPHAQYSSRSDPLGPVLEFRELVKAMHRGGIEVILDVVFNHSAEGGADGPMLSFRGLENRAYYLLDHEDRSRYSDYTGCGNTVNTNHSIVRRMIMDCLRYWVSEMHVDGFRFDLASVMARDETGQPLLSPPILWEIESDPVLAGSKIIAEAWDAAGLYQVGRFVGDRWAEWNGAFRDDVRRFARGDNGVVQHLANRIAGSPDVYRIADRDPNRSVNFVTCHDGFTLLDLVSYDHKHNEANSEQNRDGSAENFSWNCGTEGPADDPEVIALRHRQVKNLLVILLLSQGTPMLLMGDEAGRSQRGNNNAWCQDNELSWFDWRLVEQNSGLLRFVRELIDFMQSRPVFDDPISWVAPLAFRPPRLVYHGVKLHRPDWDDSSHSLAFSLADERRSEVIHIMLNAWREALEFELPALPEGSLWHRFIDTSLPSPEDAVPSDMAPILSDNRVRVMDRSCVVAVGSAAPAWGRRPPP